MQATICNMFTKKYDLGPGMKTTNLSLSYFTPQPQGAWEFGDE